MKTLLDEILGNEWLVAIVVSLVLFGLAEAGYRTGRRLFAEQDTARRSQIGGVQGAVLGLLGLLLGFTYSMGVSRFESRRDLVLKEANDVRTAYLRAGLLSEAHRGPTRDLLRRYVDVRIKLQASSRDPVAVEENRKQGDTIEKELWHQAEAATNEPPAPGVNLFIPSLNTMIETEAARLAAARNQIPSGVWLLLIIVAAAGCFTSAYGSGAQGPRSGFTAFLLPGLISVVIVCVFDLTHVNEGLITVNQSPMLELQKYMQSAN
jgi:hypothetical protein